MRRVTCCATEPTPPSPIKETSNFSNFSGHFDTIIVSMTQVFPVHPMHQMATPSVSLSSKQVRLPYVPSCRTRPSWNIGGCENRTQCLPPRLLPTTQNNMSLIQFTKEELPLHQDLRQEQVLFLTSQTTPRANTTPRTQGTTSSLPKSPRHLRPNPVLRDSPLLYFVTDQSCTS